MKIRSFGALVCTGLFGVLILTSCAQNISSDVYTAGNVGEVAQTFGGVVKSSRVVTVNDHDKLEQNGLGMIAGGVGGALAGNAIGKGAGNTLATFGGAILGGTAGAVAEQKMKQQNGIEYIVELDNGSLMTIVQGTDSALQNGQKVWVMVYNRGRSRVVAQ